MNTTLHSFMDIFDAVFTADGEPVRLKKIAIPMIQRDYAQGRDAPDVERVRDRFLDALYHAVTCEPITLDFVYGDIDERGIMTPLDGQQRLTTLFLLHWYAAKKEHISEEECSFLQNFSYETRYSARYFCMELVKYTPSFAGSVSEEIKDQAWFPLDWKKDPTVSSMLVMLDAIAARFKDVDGIWDRLKNHAITFYFRPIRDMELTDELYIKMNSRGKPLTLFEHFKAELERKIRSMDEAAAERVISKIDREWTDLLWSYRSSSTGKPEDLVPDDEFLRYFRFICDIICYKQGESPQVKSRDVFDLIREFFSVENENASENIAMAEAYFDCWCQIDGFDSPSGFLQSFLSCRHEKGKIIVDDRYKIDIFGECLHSYSDRTGWSRQFPVNRMLLLYAIICYLLHQKDSEYQIGREDFVRRIRIVNNLIQNSEDEVSDRADRNRIPAILRQIDAVILTGQIDVSIGNSFNVNQLQEEREKIVYVKEHPEEAEDLFELEDHPLLRGQISIIGLPNLACGRRFTSLFRCSWDRVDCALMAIGDYGQQERNARRYQYGSKRLQSAWDELFHKSANAGFDNTRDILVKLLESNETFTDHVLKGICDAFLSECEERQQYPWRYYYVKYPVFRPGSYGKLSNDCAGEKPYMFSVMQTRTLWSQNTYMPYLKAVDDRHLSREDMGQRLIYGDVHLICDNASYILRRNEGAEVVETIAIAQNEDGFDTEDRIVKLGEYIREKGLAGA